MTTENTDQETIRGLLAALERQATQMDLLFGKSKYEPITVQELWERYERTFPASEKWPRTVRSMMARVVAHFGKRQVASLRVFDWTEYRDGPAKVGLSPTTRNLQMRRLKALFNWGVNEGRIEVNPLQRVRPEKSRPKRETEFSEADEAKILEGASVMLQAFFLIGIDSGMRHEEIRTLEWSQINFLTRSIQLSWTGTKSKKSRVAHLTQRAIDAIQLMPKVAGSPFVFVNRNTGQPYSDVRFWQLFRKAADGAGVRAAPGDGRPHFHDTRHSLASRLARVGATIPAIQGILGHANLATTALYIHTRPDEIADAHALLSAPRKGPRRAPVRVAVEVFSEKIVLWA